MSDDARQTALLFTEPEVYSAILAVLDGRDISLWLEKPQDSTTPTGHLHPEDAGHVARWVLEELNKRRPEGWRPPARTITKPADLDALPSGSIGVADGYAVQLCAGSWWDISGFQEPVHSTELIASSGSVTILHIPESARGMTC